MRSVDPATFVRVPGLPGVGLIAGEFSTLSFRTHFHPTLVIGVVPDSAAAIQIGRNTNDLKPGAVLSLAPNQPHSGRSQSGAGGHSYIGVHIDPASETIICKDSVKHWRRLALGSYLWSSQALFDDVCNRIQRLRTCEDPDANRRLFMELGRVLAGALGEAVTICKRAPQIVQPAEKLWLGLVKQEIENRFEEKLTLAQLARKGGVSRFHLLRLFKLQYGLSPLDFVLQCRTAHARKLLEQGNRPADVAQECGFSDRAHLIRIFKSHVGLTPGRYAQLACA